MTTECSDKKPCKRSDCPDCQHDRFKKQLEMRREIEKEYEDLLHQAHREGWEQCQREAYIAGYERGHDDTVECCYGWMIEEKADEYIAAMEYKEKAND